MVKVVKGSIRRGEIKWRAVRYRWRRVGLYNRVKDLATVHLDGPHLTVRWTRTLVSHHPWVR